MMKTAPRADLWIFGGRSVPSATQRLFCFPNAGGGASAYSPWVKALAPNIEVYPVQLPGRENRLMERRFTCFAELIEALAEALRPHFTLPFAFFGHSMGALISFGLARYLRQEGRPEPEHLFLSAYHAPQIPHKERLHQNSDAELISKVLELNGTQPGVLENPELRQLLLPIFRADFAVCETYVYMPEEPLNIPLTVFGGQQDRRVSQGELEAWREHTYHTFTLHMLPGDHFFWRSNPQPVWQVISQSPGARHDQLPQEGSA
jgi:medium-chain acyl-[acyl-carrier-protein] hydrolase